MDHLSDIVKKLLKHARKVRGIQEAEAYVSRNTLTSGRVETLRLRKSKYGPAGQQLKTLQNCEASVKVVIKKAVGVFSTNYLTDKYLERAVKFAAQNARAMSRDPDFISLAKPLRKRPPALKPDKTILKGDAGPRLVDQAEAAAALVKEKDIDLAGSIFSVAEEVSLANTNGVRINETVDTFTVAALTAERVSGSDVVSSGVGWSSSRRMRDLDGEAAAEDALEWARLRPKRKSAPPGDYNVILGPYAVADLFENMLSPALRLERVYYGLSWLPFDIKELKSGRKVRDPKMGEMLATEAVTVIDDPTLKTAMGSRSYDDEGLPTSRKTLINKGALENVLTSSYYAYLYNKDPTSSGYRYGIRPGRLASCQPSSYATNLIMKTGDVTYEEMIEDAKGPTIVIPRTWYTYPTRFGGTQFSSSNRATSFIIEKGKAIPVAPNAFKLTGDISVFLKNITAVGKQTKVATTWAASSSYIVPYVASKGFKVEKPQEEE
jgi:PmbA protein